ncbi:MAG: hypothetical protein ABJE47_19555 [bacterium]
MHALAGTLHLVEKYLPPSLVCEAARQRLYQVASALPAALSGCLYVECRSDDANNVDLIADVNAAGRRILAGDDPVHHLPASWRHHPSWARIEMLARQWNRSDDPLQAMLSGAWLEFDLGREPEQDHEQDHEQDYVSVPSLFIDFRESAYTAPTVAARRTPLLHAAQILGHRISACTREMLDKAIAKLPADAALLYAGFMLGRDTDAIRLCLNGLHRRQLPEYLRALQWPGDIAPLVDLVEWIASSDGGSQDRPAIIHLDLSSDVGASIGLEYPFARVPQLRGTLAEAALLGALVRRGLLSGAQRDQLHAWPALERRTMPHELHPSFFVRRVNHVKLVQDTAGRLATKIYLCAEQTPRSRSPRLAAAAM